MPENVEDLRPLASECACALPGVLFVTVWFWVGSCPCCERVSGRVAESAGWVPSAASAGSKETCHEICNSQRASHHPARAEKSAHRHARHLVSDCCTCSPCPAAAFPAAHEPAVPQTPSSRAHRFCSVRRQASSAQLFFQLQTVSCRLRRDSGRTRAQRHTAAAAAAAAALSSTPRAASACTSPRPALLLR